MNQLGNIEDTTDQNHSLDSQKQRSDLKMTMDDRNNHPTKESEVEDILPKPFYHGFSQEQMTKMVNCPLEPGCPVQLKTLSEEEIQKIPLMRQVLHLMNSLARKEIKLDPRGFLPLKMSEKLYEIGSHIWKLDFLSKKSEEIVPDVQAMRKVITEAGMIKTHGGKLYLTEKGRELLSDHNALLCTLMRYIFTDYNLGWHDGMEDLNVANVGRLYSVWLLHHFGEEWRREIFYANEYFSAFPQLHKDTGSKYVKYEDYYNHRTFFHLFYLIGLCESQEFKEPKTGYNITEVLKAPILDMMFSFEEPEQS